MIVHKPRSVGLSSMTSGQTQALFATPQRSRAAQNLLALLEWELRPVRCRIKNPVPHPLSLAVKAAITWSYK